MERVAVVTGANRGIGLEVCRQLAAEGFVAVLGSRDLDKGRAAAGELGDRVGACQLDVTDVSSVGQAAAFVEERFGGFSAVGGAGRPIAAGAASVVWGVTLPDDGPTGGFFRDGRPIAW